MSLCRIKAASLVTKDDIILTAFAFLIYSVLVFFMLYSGIFLHENHQMIGKKEFKAKFGALFEGLRDKEKTIMFFPSIFMLRRLLVAFIIVYM